jgi:pyrroloquinoline quinone (PQQ) biosynthesis protein C
MEPFDQLLALTKPDLQKYILDNRLFAMLSAGQLTVEHYVQYVVETFHLVRHTSRALALAASRIDDDQRDFRAWLLEQAHEEHGHEQFCLNDLRNLGVDPEVVLRQDPGAGAWGMVTQIYYLATRGNSVAILGMASATEQLGAELAGVLSRQVGAALSIPTNAMTFLRSHSGFDVRHLEEARKAINRFAVDETTLRQVANARRHTFRNYGQLFNDVASLNEPLLLCRSAA